MNESSDAGLLAAVTGSWDYSSLPKNIELGDGCWLESKESFRRFRSKEDRALVLGRNVRVYSGSSFPLEPGAQVEVGDESILVGAGFMAAERIQIGRRVLISYNVLIADSDFHPVDPDLRKLDAIACAPDSDRTGRPPLVTKPVVVEDDVVISIGAIVLKGVRVGAGAWIDAGAVVTRDVPSGTRVSGNPADVVGDTAE